MSVFLQILAQQNYLLYIFENDYFIGSIRSGRAAFMCHLDGWYKAEIQYFAPVFTIGVPACQKAASVRLKEYLMRC